MATSKPDEEDELIKCSICFEIYKQPKYLPCLHTFCEICLDTYITSVLNTASTDGGSKQGFNCPICRTFVGTSDTGIVSVEEIAKTFPSNHLMVTLIDQRKLSSTEKVCEPCMAVDEASSATTWCTECKEALCGNCDKAHRGSKMSRHHRIIGIDKVKTDSKLITTLDKCNDHKGKMVEFFCVDHDMPCCTTCVTVNHRKCDQVKTLEEVAYESRGRTDVSELSDFFKETTSVYKLILEERKNNLQDLETSKSELQETIRKLREDIIKHLDGLNATFNRDLEKAHLQNMNEIESEVMEIENGKAVAENCRCIAEACLKNASDIHVFLEVRKLRKHKKTQERILKSKLKSLDRITYEVELDTELKSLKEKLRSLGKLTKTYRKSEVMSSLHDYKSYKSLSLVPLRNYIAKELVTFRATGTKVLQCGVFLPGRKLLFSDYNNNRLVIYSDLGVFHKAIPLAGKPCDMTLIDTQEAAVTMQEIQTIQFINIAALTRGKQIKVDGFCGGIAYNGKNLFASCINNITVLDRNGTVINMIKSDISSQYVAVYEDKIYLGRGNELSCYNISGTRLFTYSHNDFICCTGIACDSEGNIYVGGYSSRNIHQLDSEGKLIKIILTEKEGMGQPRGITIDPQSNKMLMACHADMVKIYELVSA